MMIGGFGIADPESREGDEDSDGQSDDDGESNPPLLPDYDALADADFASGVAPLVNVLPQRVVNSVWLLGRDGPALARAINRATHVTSEAGDWEIGVISISLGTPYRWTALRIGQLSQALKHARQGGLIVCAAAGQVPKGLRWMPVSWAPVVYPGRSVHTICAAACDHKHEMMSGGLYGGQVDITAPGVDISVARSSSRMEPVDPEEPDDPTEARQRVIEHQYNLTYGSSYATAILAGACALWLARHGRENLIDRYTKPLLLDAFKLAVRDSADKRDGQDGGWDGDRHGAGVLDVEALLQPDTDALPSKDRVEESAEAIGWDD